MSKFLFATIMITHFCSCIWNFINEESDTIEYSEFKVGKSNEVLYLSSLYFVLSTFTSVGYGDFHPHSNLEFVFSIIIQILAVSFVAYLTGNVASIIADS